MPPTRWQLSRRVPASPPFPNFSPLRRMPPHNFARDGEPQQRASRAAEVNEGNARDSTWRAFPVSWERLPLP
jgi:hypothetical protein